MQLLFALRLPIDIKRVHSEISHTRRLLIARNIKILTQKNELQIDQLNWLENVRPKLTL